jgi:hypothetical protein
VVAHPVEVAQHLGGIALHLPWYLFNVICRQYILLVVYSTDSGSLR